MLACGRMAASRFGIGVNMLASALTACTVAWIAWGLATPGDYFANGNPLSYVSVVLAGALGLFAGYRRRSPRYRGIVLAAALFALLFWLTAPDGWWAHGPPHR